LGISQTTPRNEPEVEVPLKSSEVSTLIGVGNPCASV
jgi:hypothetical protein